MYLGTAQPRVKEFDGPSGIPSGESEVEGSTGG